MFVGDNDKGETKVTEVDDRVRAVQLEQYENYLKKQNEEMDKILRLADSWRQQILDVTVEIHKGYRRLMQMYTVTFYVGVALIIGGILTTLIYRENLVALALGGFGTADVILYFFKKPAQSLQDSRSNLTQLQAAFYNWFSDLFNWNAYLSQTQETITFDQLKKVSDVLWKNTETMMKLVNKYCETNEKLEKPNLEPTKG
jgi:uncharacterized phage infection (PIP) family protein YhgE